MIRKLKSVRERTGYKQSDFAYALGMQQAAYSRMETGARQLTFGQFGAVQMLLYIEEKGLLKDYIRYISESDEHKSTIKR